MNINDINILGHINFCINVNIAKHINIVNGQIAGLAEPQLCEDRVRGREPLPSPLRLHH